MDNLWVNKYKPNNLNEIIGNKNQIKRIKEWLGNINSSKSMSLIISGNHGIGKTTSLKYILESCDFNVKMILPDEIKHYRNNEDFKDFYNYENSIKNKMKFSNKNYSKKIAMIFDETEAITLTSEKRFIGNGVEPVRSLTIEIHLKKSAPILSILLTKTILGTLYLSA